MPQKTFSHDNRIIFAGGALLGMLAFLCIYGITPLDFTNDTWLRTGFVEQDVIQHYTGWLFYRNSPIVFPFGLATNMNYPTGTAVTFSDSIPLFAIFFRFFAALLPETFQYFGLYTLLCFALQGGAAALLLSLFIAQKPIVFCATGFFVFSPILIERAFRHTALGAHFLLLFALYLYWKNKIEPCRLRVGYLLLLGLATTLHPYFLPMLFGILFADLVEFAVCTKSWKKPLLFLCANFATVLSIAFCIGFFSTPASGETLAGFGFFPMNLNALWNPTSASDIIWSQVLPVQNQELGSYEGFNYLGLSILLAFLPCCVLALSQYGTKRILLFFKRHFGLCFVCLCFTLFALSTTWVANGAILFSLPLPDSLQKLCDIFRASGRMFWTVYYLIFLFILCTIAQLSKKALSTALLVILLCLQLWDIAPALKEKHQFFVEQPILYTSPLQSAYWQSAATQYNHIFSLDTNLNSCIFVALYAADCGMTTNDGWTARFDANAHQQAAQAEITRLLQGELSADTIYMTNSESTFIPLAEATRDVAYAVWIDASWYVLFPMKDGMPAPITDERICAYEDFPLHIASNYTDANWSNGILNSDPSIVCFYDNTFTNRFLQDATALVANGKVYEILKKDYKDKGWVMVTLDTQDTVNLIHANVTVQ